MQPDGLFHCGFLQPLRLPLMSLGVQELYAARWLAPLGFLQPLMLPLVSLCSQELCAARWLAPLWFPQPLTLPLMSLGRRSCGLCESRLLAGLWTSPLRHALQCRRELLFSSRLAGLWFLQPMVLPQMSLERRGCGLCAARRLAGLLTSSLRLACSLRCRC